MTRFPAPLATASGAAFVAYGNSVFRFRNLLFPAFAVVMLVAFSPLDRAVHPRLDGWLDGLGILVALGGQALRATVVGLAYITRGGIDKRVYADALVTTGVFRHCRNPLYLGNLSILLGLSLIYGNPWAMVLGIGFFAFSFAAMVAAEERFLAAKFGAAFEDYCRSVPRWIPDLREFRGTLDSMRFDWRRVVVKEYGSTTAWIVAACALFAYEALASAAAPTAPSAVAVPATVALATLGAAFTIRALKRRRARRRAAARLARGA